MLPDSLVQEAMLRLTQRSLLELPGDLIPEFLDEANALVSWEASKSFNDLLGIHLRVTSDVTVLPTADKVHPEVCSRFAG